jgi:putative membrane protein
MTSPLARRRLLTCAGLALVAGALLAPMAGLFSLHMVQHLVLGDVAPLLLVLGLTRPLRVSVHPLVALPLWAANVVGWHIPAAYDAALAHEAVHAVQHGLLLGCGTLLWAAVFAPADRSTWFTTAWRIGYLAVVYVVGFVLASVFVWAGQPLYASYRIGDQRLGGGIMLLEGSAVVLGAMAWLFLRWVRESELRQRRADEEASAALPHARRSRWGSTV